MYICKMYLYLHFVTHIFPIFFIGLTGFAILLELHIVSSVQFSQLGSPPNPSNHKIK